MKIAEIQETINLVSTGVKYKGKVCYPKHENVKNWQFEADSSEEVCQANLANALASLAQFTGVSMNELQHIFPLILRIMKSKGQWAK